MKLNNILVKRVKTGVAGLLSVQIPDELIQPCRELFSRSIELFNDTYLLSLGLPYPARTKKQNDKLHAICNQVHNITGDDPTELKRWFCRKAIAEGYPQRKNINGELLYSAIDGEPLPEYTHLVSTKELGLVINTAIDLCASMGWNVDIASEI